MTIRYAAARPAIAPVTMTRAMLARTGRAPANDNGDAPHRDLVLRNALMHFAEHGLRAAEDAGERALAAELAGDLTERDRWLEICRALDARRARGVARRLAR
ncbi:MAG: hypothetical protein ACKOOL_11740 [Novosphingobium sp.]